MSNAGEELYQDVLSVKSTVVQNWEAILTVQQQMIDQVREGLKWLETPANISTMNGHIASLSTNAPIDLSEITNFISAVESDTEVALSNAITPLASLSSDFDISSLLQAMAQYNPDISGIGLPTAEVNAIVNFLTALYTDDSSITFKDLIPADTPQTDQQRLVAEPIAAQGLISGLMSGVVAAIQSAEGSINEQLNELSKTFTSLLPDVDASTLENALSDFINSATTFPPNTASAGDLIKNLQSFLNNQFPDGEVPPLSNALTKEAITQLVQALSSLCSAPVPPYSEIGLLYGSITGQENASPTLLDVFALIVAIPYQLIQGVTNKVTGEDLATYNAPLDFGLFKCAKAISELILQVGIVDQLVPKTGLTLAEKRGVSCSVLLNNGLSLGELWFSVVASLPKSVTTTPLWATNLFRVVYYSTSSLMTISTTVIKWPKAAVPPAQPIADFTTLAGEGLRSQTIQFSSSSSGNITDYKWGFGDGGNSFMQNPSHTYSKEGDYTVTLIVNGPGGRNTTSKVITVTAHSKDFVVAFEATPYPAGGKFAVNFLDRSTGSPTSWNWSFGLIGKKSNQQSPYWVFPNRGNFKITLQVASNVSEDREELAATIYVPLTSSFIFSETTGTTQQQEQATASNLPVSPLSESALAFDKSTFMDFFKGRYFIEVLMIAACSSEFIINPGHLLNNSGSLTGSIGRMLYTVGDAYVLKFNNWKNTEGNPWNECPFSLQSTPNSAPGKAVREATWIFHLLGATAKAANGILLVKAGEE